MPVIATPTTYTVPTTRNPSTGAGLGGLGPNGLVTPNAIRTFLSDIPELNILNDFQVEFSDALIEQGVAMACSKWNSTAPITSNLKLDGSDWPQGIPHVLMLGTAGWVLKSEASNQVRNQFRSQDGNMPQIGVRDKYQEFLSFSNQLWSEFAADCSRYKQVTDLDNAAILSHSPYAYVGGTYSYSRRY